MGSQREGRYGFTQGRIRVHVNGLLWVFNQEQYQFGLLSIMLLFLVKHVLLDFLLTVKAATLILISGRGSAISSAKKGESGLICNLVRS